MAKKIIKAQMKQRIDTKANWAAKNPVLLLGELGMVSDDPNLYKVGDGTTAWNTLPFRGFDGTIVQGTGTSENAVMSQKAVTQEIIGFSELITANAQKIFAPLQTNAPTKILLTNEGEGPITFGLSFKSEGGADTLARVETPSINKGDTYTFEIGPLEGYSYIYSYSFTSGKIRLSIYGEPLESKVNQLEKEIEEATLDKTDINSIMVEKGVLLIGASFAAANENNWFALLSEKLGNGDYYNKAVGSTNVLYDAWRLQNGTLYTAEEFEKFDVLMINHVHDRDVFTLADIVVNGKTYTGSQLKGLTAEQYEANGIVDFFASKVYDSAVGSERELYYGYREAQYYAAAFDYIFKKYRAICYAAKDNASSQWAGSTFGKPCQILLLTHWNAGRPIINASLKKLGAKWNTPVFDLSLGLGFAPSKLLLDGTKTTYNESTYYARDNEYVDNQYFGKHLQYSTSAPFPYIQRKIASVLSKILKD